MNRNIVLTMLLGCAVAGATAHIAASSVQR